MDRVSAKRYIIVIIDCMTLAVGDLGSLYNNVIYYGCSPDLTLWIKLYCN